MDGQTLRSAESVSLREYIDTCLEARDKATDKAYQSMERRLDGMNEFRDALRDQGLTLVTKAEYRTWQEKIESAIDNTVTCKVFEPWQVETNKKLDDLIANKNLLAGKASQSGLNTVTLISVISLLLAAISLVLRLLGV